MNKVLFIADLHFMHKNMAQSRGFQDEFCHDEYIIDKWNKKVKKKDTIYILGDISMENKKAYPLLDRLNGLKIVVLGNHDNRQNVAELAKHVHNVVGCVSYKGYWLTHIPVHPMEFEYRLKGNIHGHIHNLIVQKTVDGLQQIDDRYICVSCEHVDYEPKTLEELIK